MPRCTHCGLDHPMDEGTCPLTEQPLHERGPCGSRIDRYEVERWLGGGGFGGVYRARHVVMDRPVALKVLHRKHEASIRAAERFFQEAKAAAAIGHPNIVQIFDAGVTPEGVAFLAMELVDGCSLHELAEVDRLPVRRAVGIALQVLDALEAAHRAGIVHRDVKPGNIMLGGSDVDGRTADRVKLVDFGISKVRREGEGIDLTRSNISMGSPGYAAPEQYLSARDVDARADIYGMGVVLYRAICGGLPFQADSYEEMVVRACTADPTPLSARAPDVPPALAAAVDRAITRDRANRHESARAFADALRAAMAGVPEDARMPSVRPEAFASTVATDGSGPYPAVQVSAERAKAVVTPSSDVRRRAELGVQTPATRTNEGPARGRRWGLVIGVVLVAAAAIAVAVIAPWEGATPRVSSPVEDAPDVDPALARPPAEPVAPERPTGPAPDEPPAVAVDPTPVAPSSTVASDVDLEDEAEPTSASERRRRARARRGMRAEVSEPAETTMPVSMQTAFGAEDLEPF